MTAQNGRGQGDQPLYEGVVLPSNGEPWTLEQQREADRDHARPPAGQPWGQPWGPESEAVAQAPAPPTAPPPMPTDPPPMPPAPPAGPAQQEGPYAGQGHYGQGWGDPYNQGYQPSYGQESVQGYPQGGQGYGYAPGAGPEQGAYGGEHAAGYGTGSYGGQEMPPPQPRPPQNGQGGYGCPPQQPGQAPYPQPPFQQPFQQQPEQPQPYQQQPMPQPMPEPEQPGRQQYGQPQQQQYEPQFPQQYGQAEAGDGSPTLPPRVAGALPAADPSTGDPAEAQQALRHGFDSGSAATQYIPPVVDDAGTGERLPQRRTEQQSYAQPQPQPQSDAEATQMLPPQTGGDAEATQMLPPQTGPDSDSTQMLRTPLPPESAGAGGGAGQPGEGAGGAGVRGDRRPPAGFENLFRADPGGGDSGTTQSLPLFDHAAGQQEYQAGGAAGAQGRSARRNARGGGHGGSGGGGRKLSPAVLIGIGVAAVAVIGVAVGALIGGGGEEKKSGKVKSGEAAAEQKPSPAPDPAEPQAKALDELLDDSNNSRATVIRSVENIKACQKLDKAATDLRAAAEQRNGLVTRLNELTIDKVPSSPELKTALVSAWKSSAAADNHYAAWAGAAKGKKGCHKGKARVSPHTAKGNHASGAATASKKKAAGIWNPTAEKYSLKQRQFGQL